jgi:outer membrane protein OmpA-like peptidoglycan-associated protein
LGGNTAQRVAIGQLPPLPVQEPERAAIAPPPPPPAVPLTAAPPPAASPTPGQIVVDFDAGSAALNDAALAQVKHLAEVRGDRGIAITGYGGATTSDVSVQSNALALGLSRAERLATALVAQGVPFARLRLNAESAGRGATVRLLE